MKLQRPPPPEKRPPTLACADTIQSVWASPLRGGTWKKKREGVLTMKQKFFSRVSSLALAACLSLALAVPAMAADLTYDVPGGKLYFDATTGTITRSDETVTEAVIPSEIYGVPVTAIGDYAFNQRSDLASITIPNTVTTIGRQAFGACRSLTQVVLPDSVTSLGQGVFSGCSGLTSVTLSKNLTSIPRETFQTCSSLTSVTLPEGITYIGYDAFAGSGLTSLTLPSSVTTLENSALSNCKSLTSLYIPDNVVAIGRGALSFCDKLSSVRLPSGLTVLPERLFESCVSLTECTIPSSVTHMQDAFRFCRNLKTVSIPVSVTEIDNSTFYGCDSLTDVYYGGTALQWSQVEVGSLNEGLDIATLHFAEPVAGFTDVTTTDYYAQAVQWAVDRGVTSGTGANTFSPAKSVTRAEAVTFLWRAAGSPAPASSVSPFTDVTDPNAYYYNAVLWAAEQGITGGVGDGTFGLTATLAYDQIFTFLCRAAGQSASGDDWSAAAVSWAQSSGLTEGLSFTAAASCPRADVVYCLWKQLA